MGERLSLGIGWASVVREGEARASALIRATDSPIERWGDKQAAYEWWVSTFGASEAEFEEMMDDLVHRLKSTSLWRRKQRRAILHDYADLRGFLTAANGPTVVWG